MSLLEIPVFQMSREVELIPVSLQIPRTSCPSVHLVEQRCMDRKSNQCPLLRLPLRLFLLLFSLAQDPLCTPFQYCAERSLHHKHCYVHGQHQFRRLSEFLAGYSLQRFAAHRTYLPSQELYYPSLDRSRLH